LRFSRICKLVRYSLSGNCIRQPGLLCQILKCFTLTSSSSFFRLPRSRPNTSSKSVMMANLSTIQTLSKQLQAILWSSNSIQAVIPLLNPPSTTLANPLQMESGAVSSTPAAVRIQMFLRSQSMIRIPSGSIVRKSATATQEWPWSLIHRKKSPIPLMSPSQNNAHPPVQFLRCQHSRCLQICGR